MTEIALFYKKIGETLGQQKLLLEQIWPNQNLTYAGRLDPMAKGLVAWLKGQDQQSKDYIQKLPKTYEFDLVLGLETDSFDPLGILQNFKSISETRETISDWWLQEHFLGKHKQPFPPFSSRKVAGKPLFNWTKQKKSPIDWPEKEIEIREIKILQKTELKQARDWFLEIRAIIEIIDGDFRQKEILESWEKFLKQCPEHLISITKIRIRASGGTYIRWLATKIGQKLNLPSLASNINRVKIGDLHLPINQKYGFVCFDFYDQKQ